MPRIKKASASQTAQGRALLFSIGECAEIAREYDGSSRSVDALFSKWSALKPGLKRHAIGPAAGRGGYKATTARKGWTSDEDDFLRDHWHRMSGDEVAAALGRSFNSVNLRRKRVKIGRYDGEDLTIRDLEALTRLDHRQWHEFIARGWLKARERTRRHEAAPITYVSLDALRALLERHPEVYDYQRAQQDTRALLELDRLPAPPAWKRVVCRSWAWDQVKATPTGRRVTHGAAGLEQRRHTFRQKSCGAQGGTAFWAGTYELPTCPRCGCQVSRYSEDGLFTDLDPGDDERIDIQAKKIGLRWRDGALRDRRGRKVGDRDVLEYLFSAGRRTTRSIKAFEKLLGAGLSMVKSEPVADAVLLDNILEIELRPDQEEALGTFVSNGAMTAAHAMSFGKSTLGLMALTRIAGRHLLVVDTQLNREQWIEKLTRHAPRAQARRFHKPSKSVVQVFDRAGALRCVIDIYTYQTRVRLDLEPPWVVGCFDEVHRLPAAMAHRHAFARTQFRLGLSATADMRSDGRGALVSKMTGAMVGDDWTDQMKSGAVRKIPVKVILVEDCEHKHEVVGEILERHERVVVLCEALEDGRELQSRYGIPFIHSATKNKLRLLRSAKSVVMSRVGDAGISMSEVEVTVDHSGLFGSRIQSLQRMGRLMHSDRAKYHCILMTREERYERFAKRVDAIKSKGFEVSEERAPRRRASVHKLLTPALAAQVSAKENPLLAALGWRRDDLIDVA
jgi:superfamily II DNA or RNA helicase